MHQKDHKRKKGNKLILTNDKIKEVKEDKKSCC